MTKRRDAKRPPSLLERAFDGALLLDLQHPPGVMRTMELCGDSWLPLDRLGDYWRRSGFSRAAVRGAVERLSAIGAVQLRPYAGGILVRATHRIPGVGWEIAALRCTDFSAYCRRMNEAMYSRRGGNPFGVPETTPEFETEETADPGVPDAT